MKGSLTDQRPRVPRELCKMLAVGCAIFAGLSVFIVGLLQVGVPSCPTCTVAGGFTYCDGNDLTYCDGGLPVLGATLGGLTLAAVGFGTFLTRASGRDWQGEGRAAEAEGVFLSPVRRRIIGLSMVFDGLAFTALGLWMAVPPPAICMETCAPPPYSLTGIPLALAVAGAVLLIPGILLLLLSLPPREEPLAAGPGPSRSP